MKVFTTIFLSITIFLQTFSSCIVQADFFINRSYIAKNLCVNRDKPMMNCNGKCYLEKKIKEQEKQDQQTPITKNIKFDIQPFFVPKPFEFEAKSSLVKMNFFIENDLTIISLPHVILRPPIA